MKKIEKLIILGLASFTISYFLLCHIDNSQLEKISSNSLINVASNIDEDEDLIYFRLLSNGIENAVVCDYRGKLNRLYSFLNDNGHKTKSVTIKLTTFSKVDRAANMIYIDFNTVDDFELAQLVMHYEFTEYTNYGLMYGLISIMTSSQEKTMIDNYNKLNIKVDELLYSSYTDYVNFITEFASEQEIEQAKYLSIKLVEYIINEYGYDYLFTLMTFSSEVQSSVEVNEFVYHWLIEEYPTENVVDRKAHIVFNQNIVDGTVFYKTLGVDWQLNLMRKEKHSHVFPSINDSINTFYDYITLLEKEIIRLENIFNFNKELLPPLKIDIYAEGIDEYDGYYYESPKQIKLNSLLSFSHEYIHYLDDALGNRLKYLAYYEMRAVYYSQGFVLSQKVLQETVSETKKSILNASFEDENVDNPLKILENYLGREMVDSDYNGLFSDIMIHVYVRDGGEIPSLYDVSSDGYPIVFWNSLLNYLTRTYGDEAVNSIMIYDSLPDGTNKNMDSVIKEWKAYINNLSEEDFNSYY